uniref:Expressed protein n=2 Tax=Oryza sativa subsp. japonica TaxID=39947 RepID=Q75KP5_ORYSJ|nr:hypothetical protein [Oryza sativa Japonica Group]ABF96370.1 expressed protein [Oryza sativa Japonica Group]
MARRIQPRWKRIRPAPTRRRIWPPDGQIDRTHGGGGGARSGNRASSWQERPSWQRWWCEARGDGGDNRQ